MKTASVNVIHQELIASLEEVMVKQFRSLQAIVNITQDERTALTKGDAEALIPIVEQKEAAFEQIADLEKQLHSRIEAIVQQLKNRTSNEISLKAILPFLNPAVAVKLKRLSEGIVTLSNELRELNLGNQALAINNLDWLKSAQELILEIYSAPESYDAFGNKPSANPVQYPNAGHQA